MTGMIADLVHREREAVFAFAIAETDEEIELARAAFLDAECEDAEERQRQLGLLSDSEKNAYVKRSCLFSYRVTKAMCDAQERVKRAYESLLRRRGGGDYSVDLEELYRH